MYARKYVYADISIQPRNVECRVICSIRIGCAQMTFYSLPKMYTVLQIQSET